MMNLTNIQVIMMNNNQKLPLLLQGIVLFEEEVKVEETKALLSNRNLA